MKKLVPALMLTLLPLAARAQDTPPPGPATAEQGDPALAADPGQPPAKSREELKKLLAPIALYPDALLAPVLTACTMPPDIVLAKRYLDSGKSAAAVDSQPWDQSIKTLVRYPDVLKKLDADLERTTQIGEAFTYQQAEVMEVIQELRKAAYDRGNLRTSPKQKVVVEDSLIRVEPVDPDYFYVPVYDPEVVYYRDYSPVSPYITYGAPLALGAWLYYGFDWRSRYVGYYRPGYWRRGIGYGAGPGFVAGRPAAGVVRWNPANVRRPSAIFNQRAAAAARAGVVRPGAARLPGQAGFVPGSVRPGQPGFVPGSALRPGQPGFVPGGTAPGVNTREARIAAAREAQAARLNAAKQAKEARAAQMKQNRDALAARNAQLRADRAAKVNAAREANAARLNAARQARENRAAAVRNARVNRPVVTPRAPQVRAPRVAPQARAPRVAPQARAPRIAAPKAPKVAPAPAQKKQKKPNP
ncbi:MAG: DUF3300 domain-containing protein [Verrucomicrobia bacterium]|nr:DUF3300 domain-containing protein [Verrucomicrobiota bacterium]